MCVGFQLKISVS